ncbi:MAG: extracellular solute-binding protein [Anaerolineae bacterium]|jgi:ABC-type glycerol-3-phosphate transport system substrate-binding protein
MTPIDRSSPLPIYHQLKALIQEQISCGLWRPGDRIPTERELCQTHAISRSPVRQALSELAHDGVLVRRPGLGTFVADHASVDSCHETPIQMMCSDPHWSAVLERVSSVWNAEHPDQGIAFELNVVPHDQFYDLLSTAVGGGTAPDLAMVDGVWVAGLAKSSFLYALGDLDSPWSRSGFGQDLPTVLADANSLDGRLYGLPVKADASLLWYRKDWFASEGLTPPEDWDDLLDVGAHFLQSEVQERYDLAHPMAFPGGTTGGEATVYNLMPFVWSAGGDIFDPAASWVTLDAPATRRALRFLRALVHRHRVSPPGVVGYKHDRSAKLFAQGKVAMALGGSYEAEIIRSATRWSDEEFSQRVGAVAPPAALGQEPVSTVGGTSYVILRQCERPALVMDVLKLATDPDVIGDLYRSTRQNLPNPSFNAMLGSDADALTTRVSEMIASGRARPSIPEYVKVSRQLQRMFEAAISGDEPVDDIVARTAEFIGVIAELPCQSV